MNGYALAALAFICLVILALGFLYRSKLSFKLKAFGINFGAAGDNAAKGNASTITASGERAVALGGNLDGDITTGDRGAPGEASGPSKNAAAGSSQKKTTSAGSTKPPAGTTTASGSRSAAVRGDVKGKITTGDQDGQ